MIRLLDQAFHHVHQARVTLCHIIRQQGQNHPFRRCAKGRFKTSGVAFTVQRGFGHHVLASPLLPRSAAQKDQGFGWNFFGHDIECFKKTNRKKRYFLKNSDRIRSHQRAKLAVHRVVSLLKLRDFQSQGPKRLIRLDIKNA